MKKLITLLTLFIISVVPLFAQTESFDALKADYPQLMKKFGKELEGQRADYIFAIDVSGTMSKYKDTVVCSLLLLAVFWASVYCMYKGLNDPFMYFRF